MNIQPQKITPKPAKEAVKEAAAGAIKEALQTKVNLKSVHGLMVDPFTGIHYTQQSCVPYVASSWVDSQIEAGKLTYA